MSLPNLGKQAINVDHRKQLRFMNVSDLDWTGITMPGPATDATSVLSHNTTASGTSGLPRSGSFYPRGPTFSLDTFAVGLLPETSGRKH